ncbi:unnamed protein product [Nesidiocoris tenuis]|uniref:Uncharacterized protein n=1 Tax=Nesidiocoris tenuis TaxID=355587 RepID=A0A6H5HIV7_9HEMI|nr:unnamed protein product [Nesidiocoris tenuis]
MSSINKELINWRRFWNLSRLPLTSFAVGQVIPRDFLLALSILDEHFRRYRHHQEQSSLEGRRDDQMSDVPIQRVELQRSPIYVRKKADPVSGRSGRQSQPEMASHSRHSTFPPILTPTVLLSLPNRNSGTIARIERTLPRRFPVSLKEAPCPSRGRTLSLARKLAIAPSDGLYRSLGRSLSLSRTLPIASKDAPVKAPYRSSRLSRGRCLSLPRTLPIAPSDAPYRSLRRSQSLPWRLKPLLKTSVFCEVEKCWGEEISGVSSQKGNDARGASTTQIVSQAMEWRLQCQGWNRLFTPTLLCTTIMAPWWIKILESLDPTLRSHRCHRLLYLYDISLGNVGLEDRSIEGRIHPKPVSNKSNSYWAE